ncbi:hypothetical protein HQ346_11460 [Rhodococcus sp. BP-252]|uniref:Uncharacterized protein n=1 Tax=Rhodococcoides kyotonense TaxID=398843 RepID=A0A177YMG6_9NOCA|nr:MULTISPECIES: hypothetical protein [Rhodococcus]NIL78830.1 hypothetical protein [Rhodococcus sp. B10]MBY6412561.1 hypothetical protein [Rhodococcus sp. BP-320]MBY6417184.1 hypothetical protein [Rhodococcus sp. BP-321]MBY6424555.1 hypothetical protein [Rhodococcus sp. BP-324]MBY6427208.1 hypothetical protein [Rhodococcus sp. BP-323]
MNKDVAVPCAIVVTALAIVVLLGTGSARPVQAVGYSYDGVTWEHVLPTPLLDKQIRWVPGDRRDVAFHVFNDTDNDGRIQVQVRTDNRKFGESLTVSIDGTPYSSGCGAVLVGAHEKRRIGATVDMAVNAGNATQNAQSVVELMVRWDNEDDVECATASGEREGAYS